MPRSIRHLALALATVVGIAAPIGAARGQDVPSDTASAADSLGSTGRISPGGAFWRSMLVPGWGQAAVGSYKRAGFYFTVDAASAFMIVKSARTLSSARTILSGVEAATRTRLIEAGVTDQAELAAALQEDPDVTAARDLVGVREQQREDWLAFGIFMLFLGGADAFVAGHLADFPEALETEIRATPTGGIEVELRIALPNH